MRPMEPIMKDEPFYSIQRSDRSMGMVLFDDPFPHFASEDALEWIEGIERKFEEATRKGRTPYHYYVTDTGVIHEGLGWYAVSNWHQMGKNQDMPQNGNNSLAILYLGNGEEITEAAKYAIRQIIEEHIIEYGDNIFVNTYYQINNATPAGAGGRLLRGSLAEWVREGCAIATEPPEEEEEEEDNDEPEIEGMGSEPDASETEGEPKPRRRKSNSGTASES
jgi:hypothetical protein